MCEILRCRQDQSARRYIAGVQVHASSAAALRGPSDGLFHRARCQLGIGEPSRIEFPLECHESPQEVRPHFLFVVVREVKRYDLTVPRDATEMGNQRRLGFQQHIFRASENSAE